MVWAVVVPGISSAVRDSVSPPPLPHLWRWGLGCCHGEVEVGVSGYTVVLQEVMVMVVTVVSRVGLFLPSCPALHLLPL